MSFQHLFGLNFENEGASGIFLFQIQNQNIGDPWFHYLSGLEKVGSKFISNFWPIFDILLSQCQFSVSSQTNNNWRRMTVDTCVVLIWNFLVWSYRKVWILHRHHFKFQQKTALILWGKYICEFQNRKTTEEKMLQQKWQEWRVAAISRKKKSM